MTIADPVPQPKRKYTVSERVLASCRLNLEHANAVPAEIRFRPTEKRRQACFRNLKLALIAKKRDRSVGYATSFRHGWYVSDPERALPLVGATTEEYHRHLEAWRREVNPRDPSEAKLAHALGMLSWRWIAALCVEGDRETLAVYRLLDELAAEREPGRAVTAARLVTLRYDIEEVLASWGDVITPLGKIRDRMMRLWQELLRLRGEPLLDLRALGCGGRQHAIALTHEMQTSYALAEPFQSSSRTGEALEREPAPVPAPAFWKHPAAGTDVGSPEGQDGDEDDHGAFARRLTLREAATLREARRRGWRLPCDLEGFLRLVQAALGPDAPDAPDAGAEWLRKVRNFAQALWERLGALRRLAGEAAAGLNERLGDYTSRLWPEAPPQRPPTALEALLVPEEKSQEQERGEDVGRFYHQRVAHMLDVLGRLGRRCAAAFRGLMGRRQKAGDGSQETEAGQR